MPGIDESKQFVPLRIAVLTVSDTRSVADDKSGATLAERIARAGHAVAARAMVTDDVDKIRTQVKAWIADPGVDVVGFDEFVIAYWALQRVVGLEGQFGFLDWRQRFGRPPEAFLEAPRLSCSALLRVCAP